MNLTTSLQGLPNWSSNPRMQRELQRISKYLPTIATLLLLIAIAWQLARLTWLLIPSQGNEIVIVPPINLPKTDAAINTQKIADAHLFGLPVAPDNADASNAPQTQMTLVLAGVMASSDPTKGFAFIGESATAAKLQYVGDMLGGGSVKLHSVYIDRVMLDRGGRLESLILPRYSSASTVSSAMSVKPSPLPPIRRFADNARRLIETNPSAFSEIVRPQPVFNGGKLQGYRVYPGRNRQQFMRLGLRPSDLVTAVSGSPLTDQSSAMQIFNTISTTDRVVLTIEREGRTQQITINTAQIELPDPNAMPAAQQPPPTPQPAMGAPPPDADAVAASAPQAE